MPKKITDQEVVEIQDIVASSVDGMAVGELMDDSCLSLSRRTLQRRLDFLVKNERLVAQGEGRARRYLGIAQKVNSSKVDYVEVTADLERQRRTQKTARVREDIGWLSADAQEIRDICNQPLSQRIPVGYDPTFLDEYTPNVSFYLPEETRASLARMGQVGASALPAGTYLRQIMDRLLMDLAWNSSRLEGNTYSLLETQWLLEHGNTADGKGTEETQMILNHKAAIEMLADQAGEIGFNRYTICSLHSLLSDNLLPDSSSCGRLRDRAVGISGCVFHPLAVPQLIEEQFLIILEKAEAILDPFEASFFVMVHLPYLQGFEDVNKRVSRLAANIPLVKQNLCPLSFVDVEAEDYLGGLIGVYELNRVEYLRDVFVWAYTRSTQRYTAVRQTLGDPDPFRLKYRTKIGEMIRMVVQPRLRQSESTSRIREAAEDGVPLSDRDQLVEVVEIELDALHEGNIARYRLRPSEFAEWAATWN